MSQVFLPAQSAPTEAERRMTPGAASSSAPSSELQRSMPRVDTRSPVAMIKMQFSLGREHSRVF